MTEYYDPSLPNVDELIKRTQIGEKTNEFIRTTTGKAIIERALNQYKDAFKDYNINNFLDFNNNFINSLSGSKVFLY